MPCKVQIYVDPDFKAKIKKEAIDNGLTLIEFTKRLSQDAQPLGEALKRGGTRGFPRF